MLDELIGIDEVKAQLRRIAAHARLQNDMKDKGLNSKPIALSMTFIGNPGTAKTTVACIIAKMLYEAGLLKNPKPIEIGKADIDGRFIGSLADHVKNVRECQGNMIEDYICYYNTMRLQRNLGILTPMEKHMQFYLAA